MLNVESQFCFKNSPKCLHENFFFYFCWGFFKCDYIFVQVNKGKLPLLS